MIRSHFFINNYNIIVTGDVSLFESLKTRILMVIFSGALLIAIDGSTISPVLPMIQKYFGLSENYVSWVLNIEVLLLMISTPIIARLSDIYGRKKIYVLCTTFFLIGTIINTLSISFPLLLLGRALQGIGATISVLAIIIIGDNFSEDRGKFLGIFGFVIALVYAVGPAISGYLENFGWKYIFALNIPISLLVILLCLIFLPDSHKFQHYNFDLKEIFLFGIIIITFTGLISGLGNDISSYIPYIFIAICCVCIILFYSLEIRSQNPILPIHLLKKRNPMITGLITIIGYIACAGTYFFSTYAVASFGFSYSDAAYILIPFTLGSLITTIIIGKLLDIIGARPLMIAGGLISMIGMLLLSQSSGIMPFILAIILIGIGNASITGNVLYYIFLSETRYSDRASGQAMLNVLLNSGALIGGVVIGQFIGAGSVPAFRTIYLSLSGVYLLLTILAFNILKTNKSDEINRQTFD